MHGEQGVVRTRLVIEDLGPKPKLTDNERTALREMAGYLAAMNAKYGDVKVKVKGGLLHNSARINCDGEIIRATVE